MSFLAQFTLLFPYLIATVIGAVVGAVLIRGHRSVPGRVYFGAIMVAVSLWAFFNFLEDGTNLWAAKLAYANCQYLFIAAVPVLFFRFASRATLENLPPWLEAPWFRAALWVVPAFVAVAVWFDAGFGLIRADLTLEVHGVFSIISKEWTLGFWLFTAYSYTLVAAAMVLWGRFLWRHRAAANRWAFVPYLAVFLPWGANLLLVLGLNPWPGHDPTTPFFSLMGVILFLSLSRNRFFTLVPGAQEAVMEAWPNPLLVWDRHGRLGYFNGEARTQWNLNRYHWGLSRTELLPWLTDSRVAGDPRRQVVLDPGTGRNWELEERVLSIGPRVLGTFLTFHDVSAFERRVSERTQALEAAYGRLSDELDHRRRTEQQLFYFSLHDPLTGLGNRSLFLSRLGQSLDQARRNPEFVFGVFLCSVTDFKTVNERHGHQVGDVLLIQVAHRLRASLRTVDTAARAGAAHFLLLLEGVGTETRATETAERLLRSVETPVETHGATLMPHLRIGIVLGSADTTPEALLDDAETALGKAADDPAVPSRVFRAEWRRERRGRHEMLEDLGKALVNGGLSLLYQPIVDLRSGTLAGVEVLARWVHPEKGLIPPNQFIPLAELEGLIQPLGLWVIREAAAFFARVESTCPGAAGAYLSVNVSPRQLTEPDFSSIVLAILDRAGLDPRHLHLEITETALVENSEAVIPVLRTFRDAGMKIKLDDFGTGYSSLHSLHRLPVDCLKIDRSFVMELPQGRPIVRTILTLASDLGLDVVAEGVETPDQRTWLSELGCGSGQGFLFSRGWTGPEFETRASGCREPMVVLDGEADRA